MLQNEALVAKIGFDTAEKLAVQSWNDYSVILRSTPQDLDKEARGEAAVLGGRVEPRMSRALNCLTV